MITMRRNLGSILIMTTTISSITMHMKKEQGKVLFDNQINNGSMYREQCEFGTGMEEGTKMWRSEGTILVIVIDLSKGGILDAIIPTVCVKDKSGRNYKFPLSHR